MKANELMIGDWVYNKNIDENMQVYPMMFSQMFRQRPDATTEDYNIFPIPLTPEILEKNGFKYQEEYDVYRCQDGDIVIDVGIYHPDFVNIGYDYTTPNGREKGEIASICKVDGANIYTHELQHALRLCGIEKEIVL